MRALLLVALLLVAGCQAAPRTGKPARPVPSVGMPPVVGARNVYSEAGPGKVRLDLANLPPRVYVPNSLSDTVSVIDPTTFRILRTFRVGHTPQHVVPSYDLRTLWVNNNGGGLTPIDPRTGRPGPTVPADDPYNLYFTPDGRFAVVVAEFHERLDFREPHTMRLVSSMRLDCPGANHLDFSADGRYFLVTCEFGGRIVKVDTQTHRPIGVLDLPHGGVAHRAMPQDVRLAPDGHLFYVADMAAGGVHLVDGERLVEVRFLPTGVGAHGIHPSRDGRLLYVSNRGWRTVYGGRRGPGSISVIDPARRAVVATWPIPGGGSPDMGNVSADGRVLWISGRYDDEVYAIETRTGHLLARIPVGRGPHGLTVWPQPGRYSLGHTGNMR
jgi:YVTN family beta-propeller protein